jgi:hypothetical protein
MASIDLSEPTVFFLYLTVLAQAEDNLEQQLSPPGSLDLF